MVAEVCDGIAGVQTWIPPLKNTGSYRRVHRIVRLTYGPARNYDCIQCDEPARTWAWQHGEDPMLITSYEPMCYGCHTIYDMTDATRAKISTFMKGRTHAAGNTHNRGEGNGNARISADIVLAIRARYAHGGVTQLVLAEEYGLHRVYVSQIIRRARWRHV